jgi:hypothetical protein
MNMQQATIPSARNLQVPDLGNSTSGASSTTSLTLESHDYKGAFHAVAMCLAFVFLLQVDIVLRKCIRWIWFHLFIQGIVFIVFVVGLALGAVLSPLFIRVSISACPNSFQPLMQPHIADHAKNRARPFLTRTKSWALSSSSYTSPSFP